MSVSFSRALRLTVALQGVGLACSALFILASARWLGGEGRGLQAVVIASGQLGAVVLGLGLQSTIPTVIGKSRQNVARILRLQGTLVAAVAGILLLAWWVNDKLDMFPGLAGQEGLVVLVALGHLAQPPLAQVALSLERYTVFNVGMLLPTALAVAGLAGMQWTGALTAEASVWCFALGMLVTAVVLLASILRDPTVRGPPDPSFRPFPLAAQAGIALRGYLSGLFNLAITRADILLVAGLTGDLGAAGVYSVGVFMAEVVLRLPQWSAQLLSPLVAAGKVGSARRTIELIWANILAVSAYLLVAALLLPLGTHALGAVLGTDFIASYWVMLGLGPRVLMQAVIAVIHGNLAGRAYPLAVPVGQGLALVVMVGVAPLLVPGHGIYGAVVAGTLAYLPCMMIVAREFFRSEGLSGVAFLRLSRSIAGEIWARSTPRAGVGNGPPA